MVEKPRRKPWKNMLAPTVVFIVTCVVMIGSVLFFPKLKIGKAEINVYWIVALIGAVAVFFCSTTDIQKIGAALASQSEINPLKILALFLSMTFLSVFLDEVGFFGKLANLALKRNHSGQKRLFFSLYALVSVLTIFTSNDVIILSFTPFICYFAKNAKINPVPYLASEFVAANTWSMALVIGNPTNIYLATSAGIGFAEYLKYSILPTVAGGGVSLVMLYLLFRKTLKTPLICETETVRIVDKFLLWIGIAHLAVATVLLAVGSYVGFPMWLAAVCVAGSLIVFATVYSLARKRLPVQIFSSLLRIPYEIIPFLLSMFVIVIILNDVGVTRTIANFLGADFPILKYGTLSFLTANLVNNIPMSVLFSSVIESGAAGLPAIFATAIGSNVGAFLTPVGALAGIMWSSIVNKHGVTFGYRNFLKIGALVSVPTLFAALGGLWLATLIF